MPEYCAARYNIALHARDTRVRAAAYTYTTRERRLYKIMSGALPYLYERRKFIVIAPRARERARSALCFFRRRRPRRLIVEWRLNFATGTTSCAYGN